MDNYELYHWGIKGMRWGVRRRRESTSSISNRSRSTNDSGYTPPKNPYAKTLNKNGLVVANRGSQMVLSFGLSRAAAAIATARGKKATAAVLKSAGNLAVAGFGAGMIVDLARNTTERGD